MFWCDVVCVWSWWIVSRRRRRDSDFNATRRLRHGRVAGPADSEAGTRERDVITSRPHQSSSTWRVWCLQRRPATDARVYMTPNSLTPTVSTFWRPILPYMGTAITHPVCPDRVKPVICNFWHPGTLTLRAERQSARMSKITNDGLTRSGTKWFIAVAIMATVGVKGLNVNNDSISSVYVHCVQKKTPTHIFFHISVSDVWI